MVGFLVGPTWAEALLSGSTGFDSCTSVGIGGSTDFVSVIFGGHGAVYKDNLEMNKSDDFVSESRLVITGIPDWWIILLHSDSPRQEVVRKKYHH